MKRLYWNVYVNGILAWNCFSKKEAQKTIAMMRQCGVHANDEIIVKKGTLGGDVK